MPNPLLQRPDFVFLSAIYAAIVLAPLGSSAESVSFGRDVLPILSDRCFHCHGPDESHRKAKLRLDIEEEAKKDQNGYRVIAPGDLAESDLWYRIITDDEFDLMPPPDSHRKPLTDAEKATIRTWIEQGAAWGKHWSFEKPRRPNLPGDTSHPIDAFVQQRLEQSPLSPSGKAETHVQARRLSFDLTGLPPELKDVEALERDPSNQAWSGYVDKLLASPHHGERLAMWWLDAARYSDSDGYQQDAERTNWPWRDWVVNAFNRNIPFDQFTIEQFAGDLLPEATPEQILATCFHRNHMTNGEGGRHPEESRIDYVIDRVNTTGTVWMGLTLGCVQCHTHKFDPISHEDYYQLFSFFNSIEEDGKAGRGAKPYLNYQSSLAERAVTEAEKWYNECRPREAEAKVAATKRFEAWLQNIQKSLPQNYRAWVETAPTGIHSLEGTEFTIEDDATIQTMGPTPRQDDYHVTVKKPNQLTRLTGWKLEVFPHESHTGGQLSRGKTGEFILTNVKASIRREGESQVREIEMRGAIADVEQQVKGRAYGKVSDSLNDDPRNGWTTKATDEPQSRTAIFSFANPLELGPDESLTLVLLHRSTGGNANIGRFRISLTDQAGETVQKIKEAPLETLARTQELTSHLRNRLLTQFLLDDAPYQAARARSLEAQRQLNEVRKAGGKLGVMVMAERKEKRVTHILERGVWDAKGAEVQPGFLSQIYTTPVGNDANRLDLARWLVSPDHPLTARVTVNHLWQIMFGAGLVRTPADFGLQGEAPTHPDLLDWLAVELVEHDWNIRHILRLIATSDTYRQRSHTTAEQRELDPENRLLSHAPRFRLPAWMLRDQALAAAGLLNPALGGPPVKPWQPEGVWNEMFMGRFTYRPSVGPAQYRRTLYAYWRRSIAPTFLFDSAQRRVCEVGTRRTNTPLHALTLLNDTTMLEASRVLADQALEDDDPIDHLARRLLFRSLDESERDAVETAWNINLQQFREAPDDATTFATVGQQFPPKEKDAAETAALMTIASLLLNLDETLTHE